MMKFPTDGKMKNVPNHQPDMMLRVYCQHSERMHIWQHTFFKRLTSFDAKRGNKNIHTWGYLLTDISQSCPVELWKNSNSIVMNRRTATEDIYTTTRYLGDHHL
jgi:hypothetical protein